MPIRISSELPAFKTLMKENIFVMADDRGKISIVTYDVYEQDNEKYFEYGCEYEKIYIKDFKEVKNEY